MGPFLSSKVWKLQRNTIVKRKRGLKLPIHRCHKNHDRGYIYCEGRQWWTAKWESAAANHLYDIFVSMWLQAGRRLPDGLTPTDWQARKQVALANMQPGEGAQRTYLVSDLVADFLKFAHVHYRKDGQETSEVGNIKCMARPLVDGLGGLAVDSFRPQDLVTYRDLLIERGLARTQINKQVQGIRRIFKHGVFEGTVPAGILEALRTVRPLQKGRTQARETEPVRPIDEENVFAVLPQLSQTVAAMVLLQWHTGMRPGEVVQMRGKDLDRSGSVWFYRPPRHKTQHYGHERIVRLGKNAQEILQPLLPDDPTQPVFHPVTSPEDKNPVGATYTTQSYGRAVRRACLRAGIEPWSLNRLRHSAATRITHEFGIELARVILGHRSISTTQLYAELDHEKANEVMEKFG